MIGAPGAARIWIATGHADMLKGVPGLALPVLARPRGAAGSGSDPGVSGGS